MTKFSNTPYKTSKKSRFSLSKKRVIIILIIFALIIAGIIFVLSQQEDTQQSTQNTVVKEEKPAPPPPPKSKLTGLTLENSTLAERPVTGMMIENSPDSRPQSGLLQADMVFEAIAEGGVTRFLATYQESTPDYIGPVRSARPYYIDYILGLDGSYGHVGGSPEALQDIKTLGVKDLDQFFNPSGYYRISSRYAPHNMYTDFSRIDTMNQQKGYTKSEFKPLERKPDVPQTPTAKVIKLNLSGPNYNPTFTYDTANNIYLRSQAGSPHTDQKSGEQIKSKAVVALVTEKGNGSDGYHSSYKTTGAGKVFVFQDGVVSEGTWSKADRKASLVLTDKYGLPLKLTAGKTWITLVGSTSDVRYSAQ
ncbi:MAG: DUF3048 domain-containing protein [Patescibacteria group bacterium]|jgi:hypothetical protein|nr:DUF3048 domain-containing protein [Patescibacteria group bacterium]